MWKTIIRRILIMIPELILLSVLVFMLAKLMPGDPFTGLLTPQTSAAQVHELKVRAGLYDPWYVQYWRWIVHMFQGDLGMSYQFKSPVANLIAERATNTLWLSLLTVILSYAIAIPLGVIAGRYENTKRDKLIQFYSFVVYAIPAFVFYLLGVYFFGYKLHWFPTSGSVSVSADSGLSYLFSRLDHMILPALLMAILSFNIYEVRSLIILTKILSRPHVLRAYRKKWFFGNIFCATRFYRSQLSLVIRSQVCWVVRSFWKRFLAILEWGCCLWTRSLVAIILLSRHLSCCMVC